MRKNTIFFILLILFSAITAFFLMLWVTENGIGLSPDSAVYIGTAKNLLGGNGFYMYEEPMTHYPPVYPILLAISGIFSKDLIESARWLHILIYSINSILFGALVYVSTRKNLIALVIGILLFLSSSATFYTHAYAWSEASFIMFILLFLLSFHFYLSTKLRFYLFVSAIPLSLALSTRYIGVTLIPPLVISLILFDEIPIKTKILNLFTFVIISMLPIVSWLIRNFYVSQSAANRAFVFHPINIYAILISFLNYLNFFVPSFGIIWFDFIGITLIASLLVILLYRFWKNRSTIRGISENWDLIYVTFGILFVVVYYLMLIISISFFDAATPLDERILLPMYLITLLFLFPLVLLLSELDQNKKILWIFFGCMILSIGFNLNQTVKLGKTINNFGIGYNSIKWKESQTIKQISLLENERKVYSNGRDAIYLKIGFEAFSLPAHTISGTLLANVKFEEDLFSICNEVKSGEAIIVYFDNIDWRWYFPTKEELINECQLPVLYKCEDGTIYGLSGS